MQQLHIQLEDWELAELACLARARGIDPEGMARSLLAQQLAGWADVDLADLLAGTAAGVPYPRAGVDTIEQRLSHLFGA